MTTRKRKQPKHSILTRVYDFFSPKEDIEDYGSFFVKGTNDILICIYIKTNYLLKYKPDHKITYFDTTSGKVEQKNHEKNKIWGCFYDKKFKDSEFKEDSSYEEWNKQLRNNSHEIFNANDVNLYEKLKMPGYSKKMFDKQMNFIKNQLHMIKELKD